MTMTDMASDVVEARRRANRDRKRAKRLAAGLKIRPPTLWSKDELTLMRQLRNEGYRPLAMVPHFPGKTYTQIANKSRHMIRPGYVSHKGLGLGLGCGPVPSFEQEAQREAILKAEADVSHYRNPNVILLGDPHPARVALARRLQAEREPQKPAFTISAVKHPANDDDDETTDRAYSHRKGEWERHGISDV